MEKFLFLIIFLIFLLTGRIDELNVDNPTQIYLQMINILLGTYSPLRRIDKCKLTFKSKPWII